MHWLAIVLRFLADHSSVYFSEITFSGFHLKIYILFEFNICGFLILSEYIQRNIWMVEMSTNE